MENTTKQTVSEHLTAYFGKNATLDNPLPGDFILTHNSSWQSQLIRLGQSFRFHGARAKYAYWNHAAIIVGENGELIEANGHGVEKVNLSKYQPKEFVIVRVKASDRDRIQMLSYAESVLGKKYGWLTLVSLAGSLLTGLKFNFGVDGEFICSGLVAACLFKGDDNFDRSLDHITPADLAEHFDVSLPQEPVSQPTQEVPEGGGSN